MVTGKASIANLKLGRWKVSGVAEERIWFSYRLETSIVTIVLEMGSATLCTTKMTPRVVLI